MFRSSRKSLNSQVNSSLSYIEDLIEHTVLEGDFTYAGQKGDFRVVKYSSYSVHVNFSFLRYPTSSWDQMRNEIASHIVKSVASKGIYISKSDVIFK